MTSFNRAAETYNRNAVMQREVANNLLERLQHLNFQGQTILDLGGGTGYAGNLLKNQFPSAQLIVLDLAHRMLQIAKNEHDLSCVHADAISLPFPDSSIDVIFSNMLMHWLPFESSFYEELQRVLRPGGLLIFSTLGPDTLYELRESWKRVDNDTHVHDFIDMHHIGDMLVQSRFHNPVMDRETLTIHYQTVHELLNDLRLLGVSNKHPQRRHTLTGKSKLQQMLNYYDEFRAADNLLPATYEVIYGVAWGVSHHQEAVIPLNSMKGRKKSP